MTNHSSPVTAPGEILELFKGGYLSVAEAITALEDVFYRPASAPAPATALRRIEQDLRTYAAGLPDGDDLRSVLELAANDAASALRNAPAQSQQEPVAWVNGDELANMLDDRTAVISGKRDGWRNTPLYASAQRTTEAELADAAIFILNTFRKDEEQGYRSRDRQFAISLLEKALSVTSTDSEARS